MSHDERDILAMITVDKREVGLKSPCMEKMAWDRAVATIQAADINIIEMVTDAHVSITAALSKYN